MIRRIRFLKQRTLTILSERRTLPPYGLKGGKPGRRGLNTITREDGYEQAIPGRVSLIIRPGEMLSIYTPGGGGFGRPTPVIEKLSL